MSQLGEVDVRSQQRVIKIVIGTVLVWMLATIPSVNAQSPMPLPRIELPRLTNSPGFTSAELDQGTVRLDGRRVFTIAAPAVSGQSQKNGATPVQSRIQGIETTLHRIVERGFDDKLQVKSEIDAQSNLPVISVNNQYLMTVTTLDAQLQSVEPAVYADELTRVLREELFRARRERQPEFLIRQCLSATGIILAMLISSRLLARWQRRLKAQQDRTQAEIPADPIVSPNTVQTANLTTQQTVKQQFVKRQQRNLKDAQRRLIQLIQVGIWAFSGFTILGLFPYSRWLQPIVLSTPLKIFGIVAATYLAIRMGDVLIDRFFGVLEDGEFISAEDSQRFALRFSTFSRVVKSLSAIIILSTCILALLSVAGIEVMPLLAGAGIIGLGISLASQNLIKDVINGFLILMEDQYAVGDVIQVGKVSGLVESMNLRITQLRNAEGRLITIPNSAITIVENLSKDWSRVDLAIVISYSTNLDEAITAIEKVGQEMSRDPEWQDKILEPPEVLGADDLNSTGVTLRVWIKTQPLQQWKVGREYRRRLKFALDEQGIEIGVPQQAFSVKGADEKAFEGSSDKPNSHR
ncbi:mechanosensitive ion channel family protein [Phormidesmis priestleyi]